MKDEDKTKEQLINELEELRRRVAELEKLETELKKTQDELSESEAIHRSIFENAVEGIFQTSTEGRIIAANPALAHMLGYASPEELIESVTDVRELYVEPGRRLELLRLMQANGKVNDFEALIRRKDGNKIWVMLNSHAILGPGGEIVGIGGMVTDITSHKRAERNFERLLESAPDAMVAIMKDHNIMLVNNQTEKLFGYTQEELLDRPFDILVPDRVREAHAKLCEGYFAEPSTRAMAPHLIAVAKHKDGSEFPVEINISPVETEDGMIVITDIRAQKDHRT